MILDFKKTKKGFTLIETIVSVFVFSLIIVAVAGFQSDVFSLTRFIQTGLQNQSEAKKLIKPFVNEVRSATPSSLGSYPIEKASATEFIFYSDIDNDGLKERMRYFLDGTDFKRGVLKPSGNPLGYNLSQEQITKVIRDIIPQDIFYYFDSNYDGQNSQSISQPVNPSEVRLVKVVLVIDSDPNQPPGPIEITTQVSIRNLKDNL
ncbi:MAG TPA: prepilin-type N-terminal cleavage/methylation domain-containing protein [Candidatus Paceibacterota bacterium]|nr:prepilin-type N-terminal cleavage/methylation domain-containing protein [Candidatus Paceibacterota bacterium]HMP19044.1 prepilin-type N-terminal cleavage/methylation domain-containing protein [Candidatus Paceibacterota bacterium]HMP85191.1 prepilin-type N-terminal cleavage/methylation domain-containing protein [Candidatus Paceibacterota bacterium]